MEKIGLINLTEREVFYLPSYKNESKELLPMNNWLLLLINYNRNFESLDKLAMDCLEKQVNYVCTVGNECEYSHDLFDDAIVMKRIKNNLPISDPEHFEFEPMTTWHNDFEEGIWFASITAFHENFEIKKIICLNLTKEDLSDKIFSLLIKINNGWLPKD